MQQDYGQPGTAQTLYDPVGHPLPILKEAVATDGKERPFFTHHFVGGNAFVPRLIGKDVDSSGNVSPYPELSAYSYSSEDHNSPYSRAVWTHTERKGVYAQQARLAWDRLRHVLDLQASGPQTAAAGATAPISLSVSNTGSGHDFPSGFPEGRIGWVAIHAYDLATGKELMIEDSDPAYRDKDGKPRRSLGVGIADHRGGRRSELPQVHRGGQAVEAAAGLAGSVLDPVQGGRVARRRLPDPRSAVRHARST